MCASSKKPFALKRLPGFHKKRFVATDSIFYLDPIWFLRRENGDNLVACSKCLSLSHCKKASHLQTIVDDCGWRIVGNCEGGVKLDGRKISMTSSPPLDRATLNNKAANLSHPKPKSFNPKVKSEFTFYQKFCQKL